MKKFTLQLANLSLLALLALTSCEKLSDININPNNSEKADLASLTANLLHKSALNNANQGWLRGNIYAQLTSTAFDNSITALYQPDANSAHWQNTYSLIRDAKTITSTGRTLRNTTYEAIGLTMQAYLVSQLTDCWGDAPYTDAFKAKESLYTPAYDRQESIYTGAEGVLALLSKANDLLKTPSSIPAAADMYFAGKPDKWRKFINTLRLRYLLRISAKKDVKAEMQQIVTSEPILSSNTDDAGFLYLSAAPDRILSVEQRAGDYDTYRMGKVLFDVFSANTDPRMPALFRQNKNNNYGGLPPVANSNLTSALDNAASKTGLLFRENYGTVPLRAMIISYPELQFILAEAAHRTLISGNAQTYYEAGIRASFDYYKVTGADAFIANANVQFNSANAINQIITQKWISNFNNGFEGWFDYRRTGFPALIPGANNLNAGKIPTRFLYPSEEQALNNENFKKALTSNGGVDNTNIKGWWDK